MTGGKIAYSEKKIQGRWTKAIGGTLVICSKQAGQRRMKGKKAISRIVWIIVLLRVRCLEAEK